MARSLYIKTILLGLVSACLLLPFRSELEWSQLIQLSGNTTWDKPLQLISWTGEWLWVSMGILALSAWRFRLGLWALAIFALESGLAQSLKRIIQSPRPAALEAWTLRPIEGETFQLQLAMPSGHTASSVLALFFLANHPAFQRKPLQMGMGLWALAIAYSRIYLGQHSLDDVLWGALLGLLMCWTFDQGHRSLLNRWINA
jgi:membrane-associated phospholipid phosphatase